MVVGGDSGGGSVGVKGWIEVILCMFTTDCPPTDRINSIAYYHVLFKYPPISSIAAEWVGNK